MIPLPAEVSSPCVAQMAVGCWPVMTFAGRWTEHALDIREQTSTMVQQRLSSAQLEASQRSSHVSSTWLTFTAGLALLSLLQQLLFKLPRARLFFLVSSVVQFLY